MIILDRRFHELSHESVQKCWMGMLASPLKSWIDLNLAGPSRRLSNFRGRAGTRKASFERLIIGVMASRVENRRSGFSLPVVI
jgi:hypothetical protein